MFGSKYVVIMEEQVEIIAALVIECEAFENFFFQVINEEVA